MGERGPLHWALRYCGGLRPREPPGRGPGGSGARQAAGAAPRWAIPLELELGCAWPFPVALYLAARAMPAPIGALIRS